MESGKRRQWRQRALNSSNRPQTQIPRKRRRKGLLVMLEVTKQGQESLQTCIAGATYMLHEKAQECRKYLRSPKRDPTENKLRQSSTSLNYTRPSFRCFSSRAGVRDVFLPKYEGTLPLPGPGLPPEGLDDLQDEMPTRDTTEPARIASVG